MRPSVPHLDYSNSFYFCFPFGLGHPFCHFLAAGFSSPSQLPSFTEALPRLHLTFVRLSTPRLPPEHTSKSQQLDPSASMSPNQRSSPEFSFYWAVNVGMTPSRCQQCPQHVEGPENAMGRGEREAELKPKPVTKVPRAFSSFCESPT